MQNIPTHLFIQIFNLIPLRDRLRLRRVCKNWNVNVSMLFDYAVHVNVVADSGDHRNIQVQNIYISDTNASDERHVFRDGVEVGNKKDEVICVEVCVEEPLGSHSITRQDVQDLISTRLHVRYVQCQLYAPNVGQSEHCIPLLKHLECKVDLYAVEEETCQQFFGYDHVQKLVFDEEWMQLEYGQPSLHPRLGATFPGESPLELDPSKLQVEWVEFDVNLECETGSLLVDRMLNEARMWANNECPKVRIRMIFRGNRSENGFHGGHANGLLGIGRIDELIVETDAFLELLGWIEDWRSLSIAKCIIKSSNHPASSAIISKLW